MTNEERKRRVEMVKLKFQGLSYGQIGHIFSLSASRIHQLIHLPVQIHQLMEDGEAKELKDITNRRAIEAYEIIQQAMR